MILNMKKSKILVIMAILVTFVTSVFVMPVSAAVGDKFNDGTMEYLIMSENGTTGTVAVLGFAPSYTTTDLTIPKTVTHNNIDYEVKDVGTYAFYHAPLESITIEANITKIERYAFAGSKLKNLNIVGNVTIIGEGAFIECQLESLIIPNGVTTIDYAAFQDNQLTNVIISDSVTTIVDNAFSGNLLTNVTIPASVTTIGEYAFFFNQLESVTLLGSSTVIANYCFLYNQLTSIYLASREGLPSLTPGVLRESSVGQSGIIKIYIPTIESNYKDAKPITKNVGETVQLQIHTYMVYEQIDRFGDVDNIFIGIEQNPSTVPSDLNLSAPVTYQWYKDDVAIDRATNDVYDEKLDVVGTYRYHVAVDGLAFKDIEVTVNALTDSNEQTSAPDKQIPTPEEETTILGEQITSPWTGDVVKVGVVILGIVISISILGYMLWKSKKRSLR